MRIGIILSGGNAWIGGINYIYNLIGALHQVKKDDSFSVSLIISASLPKELYEEMVPLVDRVVVLDENRTLMDRIYGFVRTILKRSSDPLITRKWEYDAVDVIFPVFHSLGADYPVDWIGWIPDFQHKHLPDLFSSSEIIARDSCYKQLAKNARIVILSSNDALKDYIEAFPEYKNKGRILQFVSTIPAEYFVSNPHSVINKYGISGKYLCLSNQFFVHKNHKTVFASLAILKKRGIEIPLVCTGHTQDYRNLKHFDELNKLIADFEIDVKILGLIPRSDQIQIMRSAAAVIQPSLFEGWSTVVEDAKYLGKTIFISDILVHREQNPAHAIYFDPNDSENLAFLLEKYWDSLHIGPIIEMERQAIIQQEKRRLEYADNFLNIAKNAELPRKSR